jgi:hypothetical protein
MSEQTHKKSKKVSLKSKIFQLQSPIPGKDGKKLIYEIRMNEMKTKHLHLLPKGFTKNGGSLEPAEIIPLVAGMCDLPIESIGELGITDFTKITEELENFLDVSPQTGKKGNGQ